MDILDASTSVKKRRKIPLFFILILIGVAVVAIGISIYANNTSPPPAAEDQNQNRVSLYSTLAPDANNQQNILQNSSYQSRFSQSAYEPSPQQTTPHPPAAPTAGIFVLYPTANQTLINDPAYHTPLAIIQWSSTQTEETFVSIDLQDQTGATVKTITNNAPNNGNFAWFSDPAIPNGTYLIHIRALTSSGVVAENTSNSFMIISSDDSQHPAGGVWQTYMNSQYKFSFQYPQSFLFTSFTAQPANTVLALMAFSNINSYFRSTDPYNPNPLIATDAAITVSAYPATAAACAAAPQNQNEPGQIYIYGETSAFQGLYEQFTKTTLGSVSISSKQRADLRTYRVFHQRLCFSIQFSVHTKDASDSGIGSLYQVQKYLSVPFAMIDQLVSSFRFL